MIDTSDDDFDYTPDGRPITPCGHYESRTEFRSYDEIPIGEWWGVIVQQRTGRQRQTLTGRWGDR